MLNRNLTSAVPGPAVLDYRDGLVVVAVDYGVPAVPLVDCSGEPV